MTDSLTVSQSLTQGRAAISRFVTFLCLPLFLTLYLFYSQTHSWSFAKTAAITFATVVVLRALLDYILKRVLPAPALFGIDDPEVRADDVLMKRRAWFWKFWTKVGVFYSTLCGIKALTGHNSFVHEFTTIAPHLLSVFSHPAMLLQAVQVVGLFAVNFLIFMGPMIAMNVSQIKVFEPGDVDLGVKFEDVRGQAEAKEEVRRIVEIWENGDSFRELGGKPDKGLLLVGGAGTGKTMLAKAIATSFNAPFVFIPGSGFAATFIGVDVIVVRYMARKAKKAARKWGGTAIVFIDEIDAVGRRRQGLQGGQVGGGIGMFGGMGMGGMALNQLLVVMDSIDGPPALRQWLTRKINTTLDAMYFVPRRIAIGRKNIEGTHGAVGTTSDHPYLRQTRYLSLRLPKTKPRKDQNVFFIGATNINLEELDPALIRAGRMGRHIYFRTPTKDDRKDVLDLYIKKVSHVPDLDRPERRDELARITQGVSPASLEQICSMALVAARNDGRTQFGFDDFVDALTTLESGTAVGIDYTADETRAVALHEAGHATASHIYAPEQESSRLSIRMRGNSLGHHQSFAKEEKFGAWRSEDFAQLVRGLAAMAAEYVFYGENGRGVVGDLGMVTSLANMMVSRVGMTPYFTKVPDYEVTPPMAEQRIVPRTNEEKVLAQFEFVGKRLLATVDSPYGAVGKLDGEKNKYAAQFVGHAFVTAWNFVRINKDKVEAVANDLIEKKEIFGDDLTTLLDAQALEKFDHLKLDNFLDLEAWPVL